MLTGENWFKSQAIFCH